MCPTGCSLLRICKTSFKLVVSRVSSSSLRKFSFAGKKGDRAVTVLEAILSEEWSKQVKIPRPGAEEHGCYLQMLTKWRGGD